MPTDHGRGRQFVSQLGALAEREGLSANNQKTAVFRDFRTILETPFGLHFWTYQGRNVVLYQERWKTVGSP